MKQLLVLMSLLLAGAAPLIAAAEKSATSQPANSSIEIPQPGTFVCRQFNFSLQTPPDWQQQASAEKGSILLQVRKAPPAAGTAVTMVQVEYKQVVKSNLHDVAVAIGTSAKSRDPTAQASPTVAALLGGIPACRISVITKVRQVSTRQMYLLAVKNNHLYTFCLSNDPKDPPLPDTIEASFKFLN